MGKNVYIVHSNEYSDSVDFGAFSSEKQAIQVIKDLYKRYFSDEIKNDPTLKLKPFKYKLQGTTSFELVSPKVQYRTSTGKPKYDVDGGQYDYDKIPFDDMKAFNQRVNDPYAY